MNSRELRNRRLELLKCNHHTSRSKLTKFQEEAVACIFRGMSNAQIGEKFGIHEQVIKNRLRFAYRKLKVTGRTDLIYKAIRQGAFQLWLYSGEPYVEPPPPPAPPPEKPKVKYETAAEKRAAEARAKRDAQARNA